MEDALKKLIVTSHVLLDISHKLQAPETLPVLATQNNSVEDARKTLRWLRNLQHINADMETWMQLGGLSEQQNKSELLEKLITIYAGQVKIAQLSNPELLEHFTIAHANHAAGSVALSIALHTFEILPEGSAAVDALDRQLDNIPIEWENRQAQSVEQLINAIESGLTHLVNKPLGDRSPVDRLIEVSNNIQEAVRKLYSLDTLGEPERIESVELAREILRKLKDISFSDKTIEESIDTGRPNEKLAFAKRIEEMVSMYKNLLFEAMRVSPDIVHDPRVKSATDAANWCSNGVKLMAAKEMPTNSTDLHQISANADNFASNSWRGASLNKLVHGVEGGVEKAADEISAHEKKEQQRESEMEAEAHADRLRSRKQRRQNKSSGKEASSAVQKANTMIQHDTILADIKMENSTNNNLGGGLNKIDIAAVRKAGSSLRKSNSQAKEMAKQNKELEKEIAAVSVSSSSKITPDSRGFASRERNPLNPNDPRNRHRNI